MPKKVSKETVAVTKIDTASPVKDVKSNINAPTSKPANLTWEKAASLLKIHNSGTK